MPARYVSGYLATEKASATHAWVEVLLPVAGWRPLDPTHNRQIDGTYVKIAIGRDYSDVPPVTGYYKGSLQRKMEVEVKIEAGLKGRSELRESPHNAVGELSYLRARRGLGDIYRSGGEEL